MLPLSVQNLLDALEDRRPLIESLLKDSQDLIDNNRDLKDGASQQQHQRLKTNTADLKMRFETVGGTRDVWRLETVVRFCR